MVAGGETPGVPHRLGERCGLVSQRGVARQQDSQLLTGMWEVGGGQVCGSGHRQVLQDSQLLTGMWEWRMGRYVGVGDGQVCSGGWAGTCEGTAG